MSEVADGLATEWRPTERKMRVVSPRRSVRHHTAYADRAKALCIDASDIGTGQTIHVASARSRGHL